MKFTLVLYFIIAGEWSGFENASVTESLGDYVTESQCFEAAEIELALRSRKWVQPGLSATPIDVKGAWIATCPVTK